MFHLQMSANITCRCRKVQKIPSISGCRFNFQTFDFHVHETDQGLEERSALDPAPQHSP